MAGPTNSITQPPGGVSSTAPNPSTQTTQTSGQTGVGSAPSTLQSASPNQIRTPSSNGNYFYRCCVGIPLFGSIVEWLFNLVWPTPQNPNLTPGGAGGSAQNNLTIEQADANAVRILTIESFTQPNMAVMNTSNYVTVFEGISTLDKKLSVIQSLQANPNCPANVVLALINSLAQDVRNEIYRLANEGDAEARRQAQAAAPGVSGGPALPPIVPLTGSGLVDGNAKGQWAIHAVITYQDERKTTQILHSLTATTIAGVLATAVQVFNTLSSAAVMIAVLERVREHGTTTDDQMKAFVQGAPAPIREAIHRVLRQYTTAQFNRDRDEIEAMHTGVLVRQERAGITGEALFNEAPRNGDVAAVLQLIIADPTLLNPPPAPTT